MALLIGAAVSITAQEAPGRRNTIVFVADGLRPGSVNPVDTPALHRVRSEGVYFSNSHSVFPSQTMPNASAIATGHYPGDTGQFANMLFVGYPVFESGDSPQPPDSVAPDVEDPLVLADLNNHFGGDYFREPSLLAFARSYGYHTAAIGKTGPASAQDLSEVASVRGTLRSPVTIILESVTGSPNGVPMSAATAELLKSAGLPLAPPARSQPAGTNEVPGATAANVEHQQWFADATTKAILPAFVKSSEPFVLVFWSGDPDLTQHAQGDSLNRLTPGINGPTSLAAVRNADRSLQQILAFLDAHPDVRDKTNVFVTSDHGFSTVTRRAVDPSGRPTSSYSATLTYRDESGRQEVNDDHLPPGFLAIDLARELNLPLYDPEVQSKDEQSRAMYVPVDPTVARPTSTTRQRPTGGTALVGGTGRAGRPLDAKVIVAQASIHVPDNDRALVHRIARFLGTQDYIGGVFVHDRFGSVPGALRFSDVGLLGATTLPRPAIVVNFKSFSMDPNNPLMSGVVVSTSTRQQGQGDHGSLARPNTANNMAALGPDFKRKFVNAAPVSNADIQPTLAHVMSMKIPAFGRLRGRIIREALAGGPQTVRYSSKVTRSRPSSRGISTVLMYQVADGRVYLDEACLTSERTCSVR